MDDKKAIEILLRLLDKYPLDNEEKEAVHSAVGVLSWTSLSQSRIRAKKAKKEKSAKW